MPRGLSREDFLKTPPREILEVLTKSRSPKNILNAMRKLSKEQWGVEDSWTGILGIVEGQTSYKRWDCSIDLSTMVTRLLRLNASRPAGLDTIIHEYLHSYGRFGNLPINYDVGWKRFLEEASTETLSRALVEKLTYGKWILSNSYDNAVTSFASLAKSLGRDPVDLALMLKNRYRLSEEIAGRAPRWFADQLPQAVREELFKLSAVGNKQAFEKFEGALKEMVS